MRLSRREALVVAGGSLVAAGCARVTPLAQKADGPVPILDADERLLRRLLIEPTAADRATLRELGREGLILSLLQDGKDDPAALVLRLRPLDGIHLDPVTAMDIPRERILENLQTAAILRATYGANPLKERMVLFWGEHFNVYARKGDATFYRGSEEAILREHALGSFPAMVAEIAKAPAMLAYLDNDANRKGHPNENFARELMELHTLGVEGPYTQKDVQEVARAFTGWTVETRFLKPKGRFRFDESIHDAGPKTVLGELVSPGGSEEGEAIVERLARHPSTAARLARRLTAYFHGSGDALTEKSAAEAYLRSKGDIRETLKPILLSPRLGEGDPFLRRPLDLLVAALKATGAETDAGAPLRTHLRAMGQPLYEWPMPDGYPLSERAWNAGFLPRWSFAYALAHGSIEGTSLPEGSRPADLALALAAPEFQWM